MIIVYRPEIEFDFNAVDPSDWPKLGAIAQNHLRGPIRDQVLVRLDGLHQCHVANEPAAEYMMRVPAEMTTLDINQTTRALLVGYMNPRRSEVERQFLFALSQAIVNAGAIWAECEARQRGLV